MSGLEPALIPAIERALRNLRYGYLQLVVHDGKLVHIERVERIRLTELSGSLQQSIGRPTSSMEGRQEDEEDR